MRIARNIGLQINDKKSGYVIVNRDEVDYQTGEMIKLENHSLKKSSSIFIYNQ